MSCKILGSILHIKTKYLLLLQNKIYIDMRTNIVYIVEESVSKEFAITMEDLKSKKRKRDVILAQDFLYYILHCEYKISVNKIGEMYQRSSRNIFYSLSKTRLLLKDSIYQTIYAKLIYGLREKKRDLYMVSKKKFIEK